MLALLGFKFSCAWSKEAAPALCCAAILGGTQRRSSRREVAVLIGGDDESHARTGASVLAPTSAHLLCPATPTTPCSDSFGRLEGIIAPSVDALPPRRMLPEREEAEETEEASESEEEEGLEDELEEEEDDNAGEYKAPPWMPLPVDTLRLDESLDESCLLTASVFKLSCHSIGIDTQ